MKKVYDFMKYLIWCPIGIFVGYAIYAYIRYRKNPLVYEMSSFPWYTGILVSGIVQGSILLIAVLVRIILRATLKKRGEL